MIDPLLAAIRAASRADPDGDNDAAHDAYIELRRRGDQIDLPLLVRATRFRACDRARRKTRERRRNDTSCCIESLARPRQRDSIFEQTCLAEFSDALKIAIARLPRRQRTVVMRHDLAGEPLAMIAKSLGACVATIKSRHRLAIASLRHDPSIAKFQP
jgi:RNA polymerase sigma factor (sigma-70 family)